MTKEFASLSHMALKSGSAYEHPPAPEELVYLKSPAMQVYTDFKVWNPVTVEPKLPIDEALVKMKWSGVRLLLVTDEQDSILGILSAADIMGEKPVNVIEEKRIPRSQILVEDIMLPQSKIQLLNIISVRGAQVGHIVQTLNELKRQHVLVVEVDEDTGKQLVVGMFSISQISRQVGREVMETAVPAGSLAEIMHVFEG